ncbi:hypothetical protein [Amycolatopsis sp. H20-H5]|uniref:hypothetical protein n=1 Tax=Amycolatopsis sp. H20-H5 TaxID=3046309 RepID=UPI002DBFC9D6|nr:hypothetical protein [Amycolatopsis sp. H20-H5]MEC3974511.1 hypothetical protein [Amycolatopsis sp. H20-H5]
MAGSQFFGAGKDTTPVVLQAAASSSATASGQVICTMILAVEASGMKSTATPVEIALTPQTFTCGEGGASKIIGGKFEAAEKTKGTGNCHAFTLDKTSVNIAWTTTNEADAKTSKLTIDSVSYKDDELPVVGKVTVTGELEGATATLYPDPEDLAKMTETVDAQCQEGKENKVIKTSGSFKVAFAPKKT